jgi:hypothetical protein
MPKSYETRVFNLAMHAALRFGGPAAGAYVETLASLRVLAAVAAAEATAKADISEFRALYEIQVTDETGIEDPLFRVTYRKFEGTTTGPKATEFVELWTFEECRAALARDNEPEPEPELAGGKAKRRIPAEPGISAMFARALAEMRGN